MISVAIVEDDHLIREGVRDFLDRQEDICCIHDSESVEKLLLKLDHSSPPEVIIMDIGLPGMSGISGMKIIKERFPDTSIIMFTIHHDAHRIFDSICAGASGYLLKNTPFDKIAEAIRIVVNGGSTMSPQIARRVLDFFQNGKKMKSESTLTSREKEIVLALVEGMSYKMIADKNFISLETVRSHIKNIYRKLHVHCKADVIRKSLSGEI